MCKKLFNSLILCLLVYNLTACQTAIISQHPIYHVKVEILENNQNIKVSEKEMKPKILLLGSKINDNQSREALKVSSSGQYQKYPTDTSVSVALYHMDDMDKVDIQMQNHFLIKIENDSFNQEPLTIVHGMTASAPVLASQPLGLVKLKAQPPKTMPSNSDITSNTTTRLLSLNDKLDKQIFNEKVLVLNEKGREVTREVKITISKIK